ncbi:MAG: PD-(D/E)XK nuclease family protein [Solirubrobacteraceae bacterium]
MREVRLSAARGRRHGLQIMTFEQLAARLAGGLSQPIDEETLRSTVQTCLPKTTLGELDALRALPGMVGAAVDTLRKAWRAGLDLQARAAEHPRLTSIAALEKAILDAMPSTMLRPTDLVASALRRLDYAKTLFGPIEIVGITELSPCWRPLLHALGERVQVQWNAGPRSVPHWVDGSCIEILRAEPEAPAITTVSAATAFHEAIEALRWARELMASGEAEPGDIAIASVAAADYDDHFLALRTDANLDLHFVHGVKITASREGQSAAALADILLRGLSQTRMRRLSALLRAYPGPFRALPDGWTRILPADAPLASPESWVRLIDRTTAADWPDGVDHGLALRDMVLLLARGAAAVETIGAELLHGRALAIWRKALLAGPAASLDLTLEALRQDDGLDACVSLAWMPASALAASPRRFVRLLGLNSSRWPRSISEDRLLSDHIIPAEELDPLTVSAADRRDFATILATTERRVVLSRARRHSDGRLLGRSTLLQGQPEEAYLRRNSVPDHAFSETDRLMARPQEFHNLPQAIAASACWRNWLREEMTAHDGLIRADHPVMHVILGRTQSASSLRQLLRNPLGFVWRYGLHWRAPKSGDEPLVLDALAIGDLVHMTLDRALGTVESGGGLATATNQQIASAVDTAATEVARVWETERPVPPRVIWRRTLDDARELSCCALMFGDDVLPGARAYGEVPFGGALPKTDLPAPWDATASVEIPGAGFQIDGYIDRLDIAGDGRRALVRDYKTGRKPKDSIILDGGKELQRCLYAFAVKALLGDDVEISASLLYLRDEVDLRLTDPDGTLIEVATHLSAARANLLSGGGVIGIDTGGTYDDFAFALPANASATYCKRKIAAATARLGAAAQVWEAQ